MSGTKLFVGGLAWRTTSEGLREAFEQVGSVVDAAVITDRETGRSRGFAFVTMESDADAEEAQKTLDGSSLDGRTIRVDFAREKERRDDRGGGPRGPRPMGGGGPRGAGGDRGRDRRPPRRQS